MRPLFLGPLRRLRDRLIRPVVSRLDALDANQRSLRRSVDALRDDARQARFALGSIQAERARGASSLREAEFKAYSQFGEDGVIQWLIARVPMASTNFVEFGVEDYRESNTRFLLEHDGWRGLILDGGTAHIRFVQETGLAWRGVIDAQSAFVTAENIDGLLSAQPVDTGLLSVDVDGMDYWILSAITVIRPRIVVCEYNSLFGPVAPVSVPYLASFDRTKAHHSTLYFGASISALAHWATQHGYRLVGSTAQGVNAFMVRDDVAGELPALSGPEAWVETPVRQARDESGKLIYLGGLGPQRELIASLPLVDVTSGAIISVADLDRL
ncbi:MAG: hypothetical protein QOE66_2015 [Chloroflexota bacterium]|nr:hypothetical protein [Chloroflexota bacterium]